MTHNKCVPRDNFDQTNRELSQLAFVHRLLSFHKLIDGTPILQALFAVHREAYHNTANTINQPNLGKV